MRAVLLYRRGFHTPAARLHLTAPAAGKIGARHLAGEFLKQSHPHRWIALKCLPKDINRQKKHHARGLRPQRIGMMGIAQGGRQFHQIARSCRTQGERRLKPFGSALKLTGNNYVEPFANLGLAKDHLPSIELDAL